MGLTSTAIRPDSAPSPTKRRAWIWLTSVAALLALIGAVFGVFTVANSAIPNTQWTAPGTAAVSLEPGTYMVWQKTGSTVSAGPLSVTQNEKRSVKAEDVSVIGSAGPVSTERAYGSNSSESASWGGTNYTGVARFDVTNPGDYAITVAGSDADQVAVSASTLEVMKRLIPTALLMLVALLLAGFTGFRELAAYRVRTKNQAPKSPPASVGRWACDPYRAADYRWFDGQNWTGHTSNYRQP